MDKILQALQAEFPNGLEDLISEPFIYQVIALVLVFVLAPLVKPLIQGLLNRLQATLRQFALLQKLSWLDDLFTILQKSLLPISAWLLGQVAISIFKNFEWKSDILSWSILFLALWASYRILATLFRLRMPPHQARLWSQQILRPIIIAMMVLHSVGLLDDFWIMGVQLREGRITIGALLLGIVVLYLSVLLSRGVRDFLRETFLPRAGVDQSLGYIIATFTAYAIITTGVFTSLAVIGIPLTTFTFIAGGLSVGLGFGMQEIFSNFISGFILLFERSIKPGDVIRVGDTLGVVEDIGIRSMRIKNLDNIKLIVPNNRFLSDTVTNYSEGDRVVRIRIPVGVSYDSEPREVEKALLEATKAPLVLDKPAPSVHFTDFGDNSINFALLVWTADAINIPDLSSQLRYNIWDALAARNIEMPFPQRDIHIRSATGLGELMRGGSDA